MTVSEGEERRGHIEAETARRLPVEDEFELRRLHDW